MTTTDQPLPHNRIREFTSEATALAKLISGDFIGDPSSAVVRVIAEGLFAAYNTGQADAASYDHEPLHDASGTKELNPEVAHGRGSGKIDGAHRSPARTVTEGTTHTAPSHASTHEPSSWPNASSGNMPPASRLHPAASTTVPLPFAGIPR